jgi:hypothetical protein
MQCVFFLLLAKFRQKGKKIQKSKNPILKILKRDILEGFSVTRREGEKRNKNKFKLLDTFTRFFFYCVAKNIQG